MGAHIIWKGKLMSKISVQDAQSFAALLTNGANQAIANGQTEFDITDAVEEKYAEAKAAAQAAIDATKSSADDGAEG